ncbi:MAG: VanW family protein [Armatimonadota bacterium]
MDGTTVQPGKVFSFNTTVGPWEADTGYKRAPVSYDGQLVLAWGGGVCQTSTTLYNAALLAGLEIVERHRHTWAPTYVAPGRDAAVASGGFDLRFRNSLLSPMQIRSKVTSQSLGFEVLAREGPPWRVEVAEEVHAVVQPCEVTEPDPDLAPGRRRVMTTARPGFRACVYRTFSREGEEARRELVSTDTYPPLNGLVRVGVAGSS